MTFFRRSSLVILLLLPACDFVEPRAASDPIPVIEGILIAGRDSQLVEVHLARSADSAFVPYGPGTHADSVSFEVTGNGTTVPVAALGQYLQIPLMIHPDSTYVLTGRVNGIPVSATTLVPHAVAIDAPGGDTLVIDTLASCTDLLGALCTLSIPFHGERTAGYSLEFRSQTNELLLRGRIEPRDTIIDVDRTAVRRAARILVLGLDENASRFLLQLEPKSSIVGGFGVFGTAVVASRVVKLQ